MFKYEKAMLARHMLFTFNAITGWASPKALKMHACACTTMTFPTATAGTAVAALTQ